jgi:ribosomal protein S18 acetylase RimI-like enzyme
VLALIRGAVRSAAARVRRWLVAARPDGKRRILLVFDLNGPALAEVYGSVEFRELTAAEIAERRASLGPGVATPAPSDADSGCIVGVQAGRQVYHAWYIRGDGSRLHGAPGGWKPSGRVLFLHDGFTEPEFRGRGIHSAATRWMLARERGTDVAHAVCVVHADNAAAQHVVRKLGFRRVGPIE